MHAEVAFCPGNTTTPAPGSTAPPTSTPAPNLSTAPVPSTTMPDTTSSALPIPTPPSVAVPYCTADIQPGSTWNNYDGTYMGLINIVSSLPCLSACPIY